jgi:hypothetical protein
MPLIMCGEGRLDAATPLDLLRANNLGPLAYKLGIGSCRDEYAASSLVAIRRAAILRELVPAFANRRIWAAPLKGSAFAGTIYPDAAERPMNDIDLLLPPTHLARAAQCMFDVGFVRVGMSRKLSGYYHALVFQRDGMMVELHRNIVQPHRTNLRTGEMWERAIPHPQLPGAYKLDDVDQLLLCIVHVARHELAVPALNYVDVFRAHAALDERQRSLLEHRAIDARVARAVATVLSMTRMLAAAQRGRPSTGAASSVLPTTDEVLLGTRPSRPRQIARKLFLVEGPRELAGLGYVYFKTYVDGVRRSRE